MPRMGLSGDGYAPCSSSLPTHNRIVPTKEKAIMKFGLAWLLGVPASVLVVWYVVTRLF